MSVRGPRRTVLRAIAGTSVALLALAGCSSDSDEPNDNETTTTASESAAAGSETDETDEPAPSGEFDKSAAEGVLLTAEEIGEGYTAIPAGDLDQALEQTTGGLSDMLDTIQIEPAQCDAVMKSALERAGDLNDAIEQTAMALFMNGTDAASQSIAPSSAATGDMGVPEGCEEMTMTISGMTAQASITPVDIDLGEESMGMIMTMSISAGGQQVDQVSAQSMVIDGNAAMSISLSGADATEEKLAEVTTKAYDKAEPIFG